MRRSVFTPVFAPLFLAAPVFAADVPTPHIDPQQITVSGLSAGGQMAHQLDRIACGCAQRLTARARSRASR